MTTPVLNTKIIGLLLCQSPKGMIHIGQMSDVTSPREPPRQTSAVAVSDREATMRLARAVISPDPDRAARGVALRPPLRGPQVPACHAHRPSVNLVEKGWKGV